MWLAFPLIAYAVALVVGVVAFAVGESAQPGLGYWLAPIFGAGGAIAATGSVVFLVFRRVKG